MRDDSFVAQQPAGIRWLNVHPEYLVTEDSMEMVRLAGRWREGLLPGPGGVQDQAAWTVHAIEIVLGAWLKLQAARDEARKKER